MSTEEEKRQAVRARCRERYLWILAKLSGNPVSVHMQGGGRVSGELLAVQGSGEHILVSGLQTPIGVLDKAVLRSSDIVRVTADWRLILDRQT
ncbi:unnamed protein product [Caenorhabditis auriculariae]|uniref:Gem-associated protein 7 n=1 Tax=Caenorhabditis auriculariae TaxID=2777116 RepID=A0A8S1HU92_9PELO|nr:unnamed protein product [Caenorhabditis auriculariae]